MRPHNRNLRETIQFFLIDCKTVPGKIIDVFIIFLNILVCVLFVAETYPISQKTKDILLKVEQITIIFFIIEFSVIFGNFKNILIGYLRK